MTEALQKRLLKREEVGNLRKLSLNPPLIDFASNDYLGLSRSSQLATAIKKECDRHPLAGIGSTGSRLLTGNSIYIESLEEKIAAFHGFSTGLIFNCGYMANVGLLSAVANKNSTILYDMNVHASTHDGIRLSRAHAFPFRHNDLEHLEKRLKRCASKDCFIMVESIYSTDGSLTPLIEICSLAKKYGAHLIVDEAHAVGVFGPKGRGLVAEYALSQQVFAEVITFGKALGVHGAIVLGKTILKQALLNFARSYIYTTALPFHTLAAVHCSYQLFPEMENERLHLKKLISIFNKSCTHIQSIQVSGNQIIKEKSKKIAEAGFDVRPLMSPTVKRGDELIRISLHAFNTEDQVRELIKVLK